ncbi:GTP cyclohydrolase 1 type 2 [Desulfuromonas versatilis]|uniref:GTP cyclohydrolase 1 type 2 homolog n=1 Tax=Desulfuromonas versatilis TaxID=2802975 RepID=A0ABM8HX04_9BACT|nr:GTP cyclohydrolase 1 type 2 [Desulfuromonas versatilis]
MGLQVGEPGAEAGRVLVALDPSEAALEAARAAGAQALLTHHPLIFRPLKSLVPHDETGRILFRAVREGIAVLCAHTNLDRAVGGLNDWLAQRLGLEQAAPLLAGDADLLKLVVFVPSGYEESVAGAMFKAGAGKIGRYDCCAFRTPGTGSFRPGPGTDPFIGRQGEFEKVREVRLETVVPRELVGKVVERMLKAHPYEEVAHDLIPLANRRPQVGLGRIGRLPEALPLGRFTEQVKQALDTPAVRLVGESAALVRKVALCGGSGASLLAEAARQGADVLVTGDVKYHEAKNAQSQGIALIDAGHFPTERIMVRELAATLRTEAGARGINMEFIEMAGEEDPFKVV